MPNSVPITALTAEAVYGAINVTITATANPCLTYLQVGSYQIWAATSNNRAVATQVGTSTVPFWAHTAATPGTTYWYWAKTVDNSGAVGDFYPALTTSTATATAKTSAGLTISMSASAIVLAADSAGTVGSFSGATSTAKVLDGVTDATASWSFSASATGVTVSQATAVFSVTAMAADNGYFDVTGTRSGYPNLVARVTVAKSKTGTTGTTGTRGSMTFYVSGQSVWSDTAANTAAGAAPNGKQLNDVVVEYNASTFSQTKFWNGSAWATITQVVDGNLLITGSVGATQISASYVYAGTITATQITAGTFTGRTFQTAASGLRIVIDAASNYLIAYDSSGDIVATLGGTGASGSLTAYSTTGIAAPAVWAYTNTTYAALKGISAGAGHGLEILAGVGSTGHGVKSSVTAGSGLAVQGLVSTNGSNCAGWFEVQNTAGSHALRGFNTATTGGVQGGSGIMGVRGDSGGYAVYSERGGYGPFTGQHDAIIAKAADVEPGDIVCDVRVVASPTLNDSITEVARSSAPAQRTAVGVFVNRRSMTADNTPAGLAEWVDMPDQAGTISLRPRRAAKHAALVSGFDLMVINSVGEGLINVCNEGGNITAGDLIITSSVPGKGMAAADDVLRSSTVARARESVTFRNAADVRQIACIYLCG
jgi:hypothetical protein